MDNANKAEIMLSPYRVLDLTEEKGLLCGALLGILGADVIKVEKPNGDQARSRAPFLHDIPDPERSLFWFAYNVNKRGITLDINTVDGKEIFKQLIETADVVLESFPPGHMDNLGLGYTELEKINPRIIMTSISPFGQTGPHKNYKASDLVCWARGGLLASTGHIERAPVHTSHIPISYLLAAYDAAWGTVLALYWKGLSGEGQYVDVSIQESVAKSIWFLPEMWRVTGQKFQRGDSYQVPNSDVALPEVWPTKDGFTTYNIFSGIQGMYRNPRLVAWMDEEGMADDFIKGIVWEEFDWRFTPSETAVRIVGYFGRFFASKTNAELFDGAVKRRIETQPLCTPKDLLHHPQLIERDYWQKLEHDHLGIAITYPSRFFIASETLCRAWRRAPSIGEHNQEVYGQELGLSCQELMALKQGGAI